MGTAVALRHNGTLGPGLSEPLSPAGRQGGRKGGEGWEGGREGRDGREEGREGMGGREGGREGRREGEGGKEGGEGKYKGEKAHITL